VTTHIDEYIWEDKYVFYIWGDKCVFYKS